MPRINTINAENASAEQQQIRANVKKGLGLVPNQAEAFGFLVEGFNRRAV